MRTFESLLIELRNSHEDQVGPCCYDAEVISKLIEIISLQRGNKETEALALLIDIVKGYRGVFYKEDDNEVSND